jgi:hypothetical protein
MSYPWNSFDTLTAGDLNAAIGMAASSGSAVAGGTNNVGRNLIHNPLFNISQRTGPWTASGYTLDRWQLQYASDIVSVSQVTMSDANRASIGDEEANNVLANTFTGNAAAPGALTDIIQRIENVRRLANKTVIISFWGWCSPSGLKLGVNMVQNFGAGGSAGVQVLPTGNAVTLTGTPTRYSMTITLPSVAAPKVIGTAGDHTILQFFYSSGANSNAITGNIGVQSGAVYLWGVQLEIAQPGQTTPTQLEKPDPQQDLAKCQRFFQVAAVSWSGTGTAGQPIGYILPYPVPMRATTPLITPYSTSYTNASTITVTPFAYAAEVGAVATATGFASFFSGLNISADL